MTGQGGSFVEVSSASTFNPSKITLCQVSRAVNKAALDTWHRQMLHMLTGAVFQMVKHQVAIGLQDINGDEIMCKLWPLANGNGISFKYNYDVRSNKPLERLHINVANPKSTPCRNDKLYFLSL